MKSNNLSTNTIMLAIGTFLNKGLQFIMIPLFSRWIAIDDYGIFDLLCTYTALLIPIVTLASNEAVFRLGVEKENSEEKSTYITNGLIIVLVNSLLLAIILLYLLIEKNWYLAIPFFFMSFGDIFNTYLQGYIRAIRKLNIYSFCTAFSTMCVFIGVSIFVLIFDMGLKGMIWGYAFGYLVGDFIIIFVTKYKNYVRLKKISLSGVKELLSYSYALIPNNISWWIINVSDRTIINFFIDATANGIYAIAGKIPNFCTALFGVFGISWQETATDMANEKGKNEYYNNVLNKMCLILFSICNNIVCCNFILFNFVFDTAYSKAQFLTPILITSSIFSSLSLFFGGIQISLKNPKANGISTLLGAIVNLIIHLSCVRFIGLYAAAISTLVSNIFIVFIRLILLRREISFYLNKKVVVLGFIYLYFVIMAYINKPVGIDCFHLILALFFFFIVNIKLLLKFVSKFGVKINL